MRQQNTVILILSYNSYSILNIRTMNHEYIAPTITMYAFIRISSTNNILITTMHASAKYNCTDGGTNTLRKFNSKRTVH